MGRVFDICHGCRRCFNLCPSFGTLFGRIDAVEQAQEKATSHTPHPNPLPQAGEGVSQAVPPLPLAAGEGGGEGPASPAAGAHAAQADLAALAALANPVEGLTDADRRQVVDECYECRLCFNHCPYHPPHRFDLDFPRLMLRAKAVRAKREGVPLRDRLLSRVDLLGRLSSLAAPLVNRSMGWGWARAALQRLLGIHRDRNLPRFASETFRQWWDWRGPKVASAPHPSPPPSGEGGRVAVFYTCTVNYNEPETGKDAVAVLEKQGLEPVCPPQRCCGMPFLDCGDIPAAVRAAEENVRALYPLARQGVPIVALGPTCSYMLREEYPMLLRTPEARLVAERTRDVMELLAELRRQGRLAQNFVRGAGRVAYHLPCHLKSQNIGFRSREVLAALPDTTVTMVDRCSAHDGTWSMKEEYFELSLKYGRKLFEELQAAAPDVVASDCPLAALQIEKGTGRAAQHPVRLVARAYGIDPA